MTKPENVLFLHIPKTAGTSLKHYLFHRYSVEQCLLDPPPRAPGARLRSGTPSDNGFAVARG